MWGHCFHIEPDYRKMVGIKPILRSLIVKRLPDRVNKENKDRNKPETLPNALKKIHQKPV